MRKFIWLTSAAILCATGPVLAKNNNGNNGNGNGNGGNTSNPTPTPAPVPTPTPSANGNGNGNNGNGNGNGGSNSSPTPTPAPAPTPTPTPSSNGNGNGNGNNGNGNGNGGSNSTPTPSPAPAPSPTPTPTPTQSNNGNGNSTPTPTPAPALTLNGACSGDFATTTLACVGYADKNVLNQNDSQIQKDALALIGFAPANFDFNSYQKIDSNNGKFTIDFGQMLYGETIVGVHFGGGSDVNNGTGFYKLDAGSGLAFLTLLEKASSGVVLYKTDSGYNGGGGTPTAVPEPATWAMMLGGLGMLGAVARRRKTVGTAVTV